MQTQMHAEQTNLQSAAGRTVTAPTLPDLPAERRLMQRVLERCGEVIDAVCATSSVPPEFLGALAASESGGRADATRFEPGVYRHLEAVGQGKSPAYGSINLTRLDRELALLLPPTDAALHARYLTAAFEANHREQLQGATDELLRELSTSWGYTQIMGYHMIGQPGPVRRLLEPQFHFRMAIRLLSEFAAEYQLDLAREFSELFCCWNTGRPYGKTFDPDYVAKSLVRMRIYRRLLSIRGPAR